MEMEALWQIERRFWTDRATFDDHFDSAGVFVLPVGILDHDQVLDSLDEMDEFDFVMMENQSVKDISPNAAMLFYHMLGGRAGEKHYQAACASLYQIEHDMPVLSFHQQTPLLPTFGERTA